MNQGSAVAEAVDVAHIIAELNVAYRMEIETTINYLALSTNLDGVRTRRSRTHCVMT